MHYICIAHFALILNALHLYHTIHTHYICIIHIAFVLHTLHLCCTHFICIAHITFVLHTLYLYCTHYIYIVCITFVLQETIGIQNFAEPMQDKAITTHLRRVRIIFYQIIAKFSKRRCSGKAIPEM